MTARARASVGGSKSCAITYFSTGHLHAALSVPRTEKTRWSGFTPDDLDVIFHGLIDFAGLPAGELIRDDLLDEIERERS